jgi:hypothetical protein
VAVFGVLALVAGLLGLVRPAALLALLGFAVVDPDRRAAHDHTLVFVAASSMAAVNMGAYYILAALSGWRPFFRWTVPFRVLTCAVFGTLVAAEVAPVRFLGVALWEGLGAAATAVALRYEARRTSTGSTG